MVFSHKNCHKFEPKFHHSANMRYIYYFRFSIQQIIELMRTESRVFKNNCHTLEPVTHKRVTRSFTQILKVPEGIKRVDSSKLLFRYCKVLQ